MLKTNSSIMVFLLSYCILYRNFIFIFVIETETLFSVEYINDLVVETNDTVDTDLTNHSSKLKQIMPGCGSGSGAKYGSESY